MAVALTLRVFLLYIYTNTGVLGLLVVKLAVLSHVHTLEYHRG